MEHEFNPAAVTPNRSRGRPATVMPTHEIECRLTPPNQKRPEFNMEPFTKFVAFEEGGEGTGKQLHYHILLETTMSTYKLAQYWNESFPEGKGSGNKLFRNGLPHEKTKAYISKFKTPVAIKGYTESDLQAWYKESDEYVAALKRERERYRRIKSMGRKAELKSVEEETVIFIKAQSYDDGVDSNYIVHRYIEKFLEECKNRSFDFPTRSQMDIFVSRCLYDIRPAHVRALYARNIVVAI